MALAEKSWQDSSYRKGRGNRTAQGARCMGKPKKKDLPDLSHLAVAGAEISVRVTPKAARNAVQVTDAGLKVQVTTAPAGGKATEAVRQLLALALGIASSRLELRRGATARDKVFVVLG